MADIKFATTEHMGEWNGQERIARDYWNDYVLWAQEDWDTFDEQKVFEDFCEMLCGFDDISTREAEAAVQAFADALRQQAGLPHQGRCQPACDPGDQRLKSWRNG